jgi:8-oxo-dGTP pyrophosphatase MutT (NUDIX family)
MGFLRHIEACNRFDPDQFLPFYIGDVRVGQIPRAASAALGDYPGTFRLAAQSVSLSENLGDPASRTAAIGAAGEDLVRRGVLPGRRGELFAITAGWGGDLLVEIDRGVVPFFGTRSYGVHLNGFRGGSNRQELWIGKRAADKKTAPGKLDNLIAGGIASGYGAHATLLKEAAEEASMPADIAATARPAGAVFYRMAVPNGSRDDVLFIYDIDVPADFVPRNSDGEIEDFRVLAVDECLRRVAETDDFKFNVNLVLIDLAVRHGRIAPDHSEYLALVTGLRRGS